MAVAKSFCLWLVVCGGAALAQEKPVDLVWLEPPRPTSMQSDWYPQAIEKLRGTVVDLDAKQLRCVVAGDEAETIVAAHRVLHIEPAGQTELASEAIRLYEAGEYAQSLSKLPAVLQERPPVWRQQWLTMTAASAAWKSGRGEIALELVAQLDKRPLAPLVLSRLPIAWVNSRQPADTINQARERLDDPSAAVQLVAASWLLFGSDRNSAQGALKNLQASQRSEIAALAEILLWRTATPPEVQQMHAKWESKINRLPMVLQDGPMQTLIDKLQAAGIKEKAKHLRWSLELN